ncbi:GNAT family N-acetyltransferase [Paenarthrobacter sp. Z7-10]|uniref:GNAT family N-acetyltransferase n=1 Tax=Paenarthrobacter sp. Z7-10 TaxID=2787635 RepID=UPI0022A98BC7|nr:GNAT family protein [Paenarthrobacter sp. Z7-10]MCZ2404352.1 GNAT family N-acetyltransferase [Paenarthrobacter sp. Z7-10]
MWGQTIWPVTLECGDIILRPIRRRDKTAWTELRSRNFEWLAPWEASSPSPGGQLPTFGGMVRGLNEQARAASALPFIIAERAPGRPAPKLVGQLTVSSIVWGSAMMATLGYWVDKDHAGRGITPTAVAMATDHCFLGLGLHRMEINIRPENAPSLRVVEKLGFRDEGLRPRYLHINGRWADHRSFALTSEEVPGGLLERWLANRSS